MKVVNEDRMFNLKSVSLNPKRNSVILELETISAIPREFQKEDYKRIKLTLIDCQEINKVYDKLKEFEDNFIDIEQLENGNLDIWSESIQVVEIILKSYEESVEDYSKEDWILEYESLTKAFYKNYDLKTKFEVVTRKFENRLQTFLEDELRRIEIKSQLVSKDKFEKRTELAKQVLNLLEQYKIEKKENGS